jgi:outer membrane lipoprotein carrier protein
MKLRVAPGTAIARTFVVGCVLVLAVGTAVEAEGAGATTALAGAAAATAASTPLDVYLDNLKTLRADFLQTLVDAHGREIDRSTGTLVVSRPGKFRWEIHPQQGGGAGGAGANGTAGAGGSSGGKGSAAGGTAASGQLMVADGRNLWFLDRDLEQVTVKPVDTVLSATPAMLLSGTVDVRKHFTIKPAGQRDGLEWVLVEPNGADADFRSVLFGFDRGELKRMILDDKLGQTATISFQRVVRNGPVSPEEVSFTPPPGVDVIGTPQK